MKQSVEKVDSAAPGNDRKVVTCTRCFARVSGSDIVCPECGAPMGADAAVPAVDTAVHADLAQANLFKLRGDAEAAEKKCLSILKRFPNEPEAHSLLGDISAERGDWARAAEWFELALDLNPKSAADHSKFEEAKRHIKEAEIAETVEQLGLPEPPSRTPWLLAGAFVIIVALGLGAFKFNNGHKTAPAVEGGTIHAPRQESDTTTSTDAGATDDPSVQPSASETNPTAAPTAAASPMEDRALLQLLQQRSTAGSAISSVEQDPRDKALIVTYTVTNGEDAKKIGATLAKDALEQSQDTLIVTVRGTSGDHLVFVADATRPKLTEIESQAYQTQNATNPDAWMSVLLQREWLPSASGTASPPSGSTATPTTSTPGSTGTETTAGH